MKTTVPTEIKIISHHPKLTPEERERRLREIAETIINLTEKKDESNLYAAVKG